MSTLEERIQELPDHDLIEVDRALHEVKARHSHPVGNPVFKLLHDLTQPICDELERRLG